ncbi:hypothetical protein BU17DRAFT_66454 [Hysterangium stoloniferum]|nr:hypothetical protein BU17DRAFT_66454 [Hysterangium stoloniferum]
MSGVPFSAQGVAVGVRNDWDRLAEVAVVSNPEGNAQLDSLALLLESHGTIVRRVSAPSLAPEEVEQANQTRLPSLFPQNAALVHDSRVIEVPPLVASSFPESDNEVASPHPIEESKHRDALFRSLECAGVEVVRWKGTSSTEAESPPRVGKLVDVQDMNDQDSPKLFPSDVVILSPSLLITRLSSFTNNKGLEYLWSVLSQLPKPQTHSQPSMFTSSYTQNPLFKNRTLSPTTLLVRVIDPDAPSPTHSTLSPSPQKAFSPRSQTFSQSQLAPSSYTPLSRALIPIDARIMLYDPALIPDTEARRLKSILDRLQEVSQHDSLEPLEAAKSHTPKRDSVVSYGTFGSLGGSGDGWEFISVDSLHLASVLMVSSTLALVSLVSPHPTAAPSDQNALANVVRVLDTLGVNAVQIPPPNMCIDNVGIRDAVMVLRRDSDTEPSEVADDQPEEEGCMETITGLATLLCGCLTAGVTPDDASSDA